MVSLVNIEIPSKSYIYQILKLFKGNPGWGKTVLAASVVEELLQDLPDFSGEELGYFFFRHADPKQSSIDAAYRSVLAQILHRNRNDCILIDKFLFAKYGTKSLGQLMASSTELLSLVHACASHFGHLRFVFDGLDEASGDDNMAQSFKSLICTWPISLMCFSRTNVRRMSTVVPDTRTISLTRAITGSDIEAYLSSQLLNLVDDELLPPGSIQPLLDRLVRGADGMFLWAKLMIRFLNSPALSPRSRIEHIQTIIYPEGLEAMYDRILRLIIGSEGPESKLARGVLSWLSSSMADTHTDHIGLLRWFMGTNTDNADVPDATFLSMIMSACCGLIESVWCYVVIGVGGSMEHRSVLQIRFVHMSVKMFFAEMQGRPDAYAGLVPTRVASSAGIMQRCLLTLLEHAPSTAPPRLLGAWHHIFSTEDVFAQSYIAYSTKYWISHLEEALAPHSTSAGPLHMSKEVLSVLCQFLGSPNATIAWIEALYTVKADVVMMAKCLVSCSEQLAKSPTEDTQELTNTLAAMSEELQNLDHEWGSKLIACPSLMWDDVQAFNRPGQLTSLHRSDANLRVSYLTPSNLPEFSSAKRKVLATISSTSVDGKHVGALYILPPDGFEAFAAGIDPKAAYHDVEKFCRGWVAHYEVWRTSSRERVGSINVTLEASEMTLLFRQSFRRDLSQDLRESKKLFDTSFPMAIGPKCESYSVLRTVYHLRLEASADTLAATVEAGVLSMDFLGYFSGVWCLEKLATYTYPTTLHEAVPELAGLGIRDWYTYLVSFNQDESLLFFADYQRPFVTHVAMYRVNHEGSCRGCLKPVLLSYAKHTIGPRVKYPVFHPEKPLISFVAGNQVWVWPYLDRKSSR